MEFLDNQISSLVIAGVCVLVLLFILGKFGFKLIKRILKGAVLGILISVVLYYVVHLPLETVAVIGLITFLLGAIFGKVN